MTLYATPGGTPLNASGFQGTAPGNPVGATLQQANPGVGMFPPNSDNRSGDSALAAVSRGAIPANVLATNYGTRDSRAGQAVAEVMSKGAVNGSTANAVNSYLWANGGTSGGNSLGAGGSNQTDGPGGGETSILAASAPASSVTIPAAPQYQG